MNFVLRFGVLAAMTLMGCTLLLQPNDQRTIDDSENDANGGEDEDSGIPGDGGSEGGDTGEVEPTTCESDDRRCLVDELRICRDGRWETLEDCELGCLESGGAHCARWVPSNVDEDALSAGDGPLSPEMSGWPSGLAYMQIYTDTGEIWGGTSSDYRELRPAGEGLDEGSGIAYRRIHQGEGAPDIGVFSVTGLSIPAGASVWAGGESALAFASSGEIIIEGTLYCRAIVNNSTGERLPGPGGFDAGEGPGAGDGGGSGSFIEGGGGGGSFGGIGGRGSPRIDGGEGGLVYGAPELVPLFGGSGGGSGANTSTDGGAGGGGCQLLSSLSILIAESGAVDAGGHGGRGSQSGGGGGGGGSGGALLFEAPEVTIHGNVSANGGGGGSGATDDGSWGADGSAGDLSGEEASGGQASTFDGRVCDGGHGSSALDSTGGEALCQAATELFGGGGGGGSGRIRVNALSATVDINALSPSPETPAASTDTLPLE